MCWHASLGPDDVAQQLRAALTNANVIIIKTLEVEQLLAAG